MMKPTTSISTALVLGLLVAACGGSTASEPDAKIGEGTPAIASTAEAAEEEPPYDVDVQGWEGAAGEDAQLVVTVKARDGFKINKDYPHKIVLETPPDGVSLPMMTVRKKDAKLDGDKSITYSIPAKAAKSGDYAVKGLVKLSVCNEEQCRMAKEEMTASLSAK